VWRIAAIIVTILPSETPYEISFHISDFKLTLTLHNHFPSLSANNHIIPHHKKQHTQNTQKNENKTRQRKKHTKNEDEKHREQQQHKNTQSNSNAEHRTEQLWKKDSC
jgi:hypothetical protein